MRPERRGVDFQEQSRARVEQRQEVRNRKAAAFLLIGRLSEMSLKHPVIGHRE